MPEKLLLERVRNKLTKQRKVQEKVMFRGIVFMINGKMCFSVGGTELMCRIDPTRHDEALERPGTRSMYMRGKPCKGYVFIDENELNTDRKLNFWINLAMEFNTIIAKK